MMFIQPHKAASYYIANDLLHCDLYILALNKITPYIYLYKSTQHNKLVPT